MMCFPQPDNGAEQARADQEHHDASVAAGKARVDETFGQFNNKFFSDRSKSYLDYATPQLVDQYTDAKKKIVYALNNSGQLNSSVANQDFANLDKQRALQEAALKGTAADLANQARQNVEQNRSDILDQLYSSGDASGATSAALLRSKTLTAQPAFSPIGQLFTNLSALAAQNKLAQDGSGSAPSYGVKLFGSSGSSPSYSVGG